MKVRTVIVLAASLCGVLMVGGGVWAMSSGSYTVNWDIIGAGGESADSTNYAMEGTLGQPAAESSFSANYNLWSGYWHPAAPATPPAGAYDLTISSTAGGTVITPGEGTFRYDQGAAVDLIAEPEEGYYFVNWTGDVGTIGEVDSTITTITMNGNYGVTANFVKVYDLLIHDTTGGWASRPGWGAYTYEEGTVVDLEVTTEAGYEFVEWTGDVGTIANVKAAKTTITMWDNYEITPSFQQSAAPGVCPTTTADVGPLALVSVALVGLWVRRWRGGGSWYLRK